MDILPEYAVICGLDLRTLSSVTFTDRSHVRQLQLDDPVTGDLLRKMEAALQQESEVDELSQYSIQEGGELESLFYEDFFYEESLKCTLLRYYHDHPTVGHLGITKTIITITNNLA